MVQPQSNDPAPKPYETAGFIQGNTFVIPILEETAELSTRFVDTETIRIQKHVQQVEQTLNRTLHQHHVDVERVPLNRIVDSPPDIRTEGDTTIIPIVEEIMVRALVLKEELRITRRTLEKNHEERVTLRREEVLVTRTPAPQIPQTPTNGNH